LPVPANTHIPHFVRDDKMVKRPGTIQTMERKIFWMVFLILGLLADFLLPFWWAFFATIPILFFSWWVAYRSGWF
jgi:hypothetical protein